MPPKIKNEGGKPRCDTSPGNANGWLPATDWSSKETQRCIQLITSIALENRSQIYTDEALRPWNYNGATPIYRKLQQILAKICKDYEVEMLPPATTKSPKKRTTASADDDDDDKKTLSSPKKPRKQPTSSPKKANKGPNPSEAGASVGSERMSSTTMSTEDDGSAARSATTTEDVPSTPTRKQSLNTAAPPTALSSANSSEEDCDEDELPFQPAQ